MRCEMKLMNESYHNKVEFYTTKLLNSAAGVLLFLVSMAAFYLPYEVRIIPVVKQYLVPVRLVCAGLLILALFFLYCSSLTFFRGNWALLAACAFVGVLIFSTRMNGGDMENALGTYGLAGVFLVMTIAVFFRVNPKKYLLLAFFLLLAANIANIYTVYHYWGVGMWEEYGLYRNIFFTLVGNYNGGIEYVLPMAICGSAYAARYVAKNIVAAGLADKCEIQLSYAIGVANPTSVMVDTFGTGKLSDKKLEEIVRENFDLRPAGIIKMLDLRRPVYKQTAAYGHFGRNDLDLPWEKLDKTEILKAYI